MMGAAIGARVIAPIVMITLITGAIAVLSVRNRRDR